MSTILVVDDEKNIVSGLKMAFEDEGYSVISAENGLEALDKIKHNIIDLLITDLRMPELSGDELIKRVSSSYPTLPIIVLTGHGTIETAVETMRNGAIDFFTKPVDLDKLLLVVKKTLETSSLKKQNEKLSKEIEKLKKEKDTSLLLGSSNKMISLRETISQVASTPATVLILGETGTGKELVADEIVSHSDRRDKSFIKLHCASLTQSLLEDELFGHEKGAFTGAISQKKGRFELADGGTLFLDEIGEIDKNTQVKLLRVLQEREFERVGGEKTIKVDVRVIAATNKNLKEEVEKGNFREDLYYRLSVVNITVPPLRERREDIDLLVSSFIKEFNEKDNRKVIGVTPSARKLLYSYPWKGNVRELRSVIENAVIFCKGNTIDDDDLSPDVRNNEKKSGDVHLVFPFTLEEAEKVIIEDAILYSGGNKSKASEMLQIGRKTLHRKLDEWKESNE